MKRPSSEVLDELQERYAPVRVLGSGGVATVWLVEDLRLGRKAALKVLREAESWEDRSRFLREARLLSQIRHPHVVELFDFGSLAGGDYLVMEYLEGRTTAGLGADEPFLEYLLPVADVLEYLHGENLIHRDLKPGNLFRTDQGKTVLMDFGMARAGPGEESEITRQGQVLGTVPFLAPEVLRGGEATAAADWWAFGVTLYKLYERDYPFSLKQLFAAMSGRPLPEEAYRVLGDEHPAREYLAACLQRDPTERLQALRELRGQGQRGSGEKGPGLEPAREVSCPDLSEEHPSRGIEPAGEGTPAQEESRPPWWLPMLVVLCLVGVLLGVALPGGSPDGWGTKRSEGRGGAGEAARGRDRD